MGDNWRDCGISSYAHHYHTFSHYDSHHYQVQKVVVSHNDCAVIDGYLTFIRSKSILKFSEQSSVGPLSASPTQVCSQELHEAIPLYDQPEKLTHKQLESV